MVTPVDELTALLETLDVSDSSTATDPGSSVSTSSSVVSHGDIDWPKTGRLAQACADSLRTEQARDLAGQGALVQVCAQVLDASLQSQARSRSASPGEREERDEDEHGNVLGVQTQLGRVVGNLVLDHPSNRRKCTACLVPQRLLRVLGALQDGARPPVSSARLLAIKACTGALLNLAIDTPEIRDILLDSAGLDTLARSLSLYQVSEWSSGPAQDLQTPALLVDWTVKLIAELASADKPLAPAVALTLIQAILGLRPSSSSPGSSDTALDPDTLYSLLETDLSILSGASEVVEAQAYKSEAIQEAIAFASFPLVPSSTLAASTAGPSTSTQTPLLGVMLDYVESAEMPRSWSSALRRSAAAGEADDLEADKTFSNVKASVARIAIAAVGADKVMHEVFKPNSDHKWLFERCTAWLAKTPDLVITSSTILANLARKDAYCIALVHDYSIAPALAHLLAQYASPSISTTSALSRPGEATQVLHGVTGLLKNLAITGGNKQTLCDEGVIGPLALLLRPSLDVALPLQNAAIGTLKHLCAGNVSSALRVVLPSAPENASHVVTVGNGSTPNATQEVPLNAIFALISRTNDVRLRCEATRLIGNVVRSLYSSRSITSPITPAALHGLETGLAKSKAKDVLEHSNETVEALSELLRTGEKYPSLVNEAIVALTLLCTTTSGAALTVKAISKQHEVPASAPTNGSNDSDAAGLTPASSNGLVSSARKAVTPRQDSLMTRYAPATAADIVLRWLNEYAIASATMPPEMAGNVLALLDGIFRSSTKPNERETLPLNQLKVSLVAVTRRKSESPQELALKATATNILAELP